MGQELRVSVWMNQKERAVSLPKRVQGRCQEATAAVAAWRKWRRVGFNRDALMPCFLHGIKSGMPASRWEGAGRWHPFCVAAGG
jgi:hypothetical protein